MSTFFTIFNAVTASSAFSTIIINIITAFAIRAVPIALYTAINTIVPALRAHLSAIFTKIAIDTIIKSLCFKAGSTFTAVKRFFKFCTFNTEITADFTNFGTICTGTTISADSIYSIAHYTFTTIWAKPTVVFTADCAVIAAAFALTVYLKAFIAFYTMVIVVAYTAKLAIGADIFAVVANTAILTIYFTEIAEAAFGAGLAVCFVAFHAYFFAIFADLNAIFTEVAFGADKHAILTGIAAITAV